MPPDQEQHEMDIKGFMEMKPESRLYSMWDMLKGGEGHFKELDNKFITLQNGNKALWDKLDAIEKKLDTMCGGCVAIEIRQALEEHKGDAMAHPDDVRLLGRNVKGNAVLISISTAVTAALVLLLDHWPFK